MSSLTINEHKVKILLTGSEGFLGKHISQKLKGYNIVSPSKKDLDLTNTKETDIFFDINQFDFVIHCAVSGGDRMFQDSIDCLSQNVAMALNLQRNKSSFRKLIHFGSGAELDRSLNISGDNNSIYDKFPNDYYGLSKNIVARIFDNQENFYNLRIFNVFAENELPRRMIKYNINNYIENKPIVIHQEKMMDFFYIDDLITIISHYVEEKCNINEIDCVYKDKTSLSQIANIINNLSDHKVPVIVESKELTNDYLGKYSEYFENVNFFGLDYGIKKIYESLL
jgi:GDP-L-fucose synthase